LDLPDVSLLIALPTRLAGANWKLIIADEKTRNSSKSFFLIGCIDSAIDRTVHHRLDSRRIQDDSAHDAVSLITRISSARNNVPSNNVSGENSVTNAHFSRCNFISARDPASRIPCNRIATHENAS